MRMRPLRVAVVTVTHLPEDARIRYRQIPAMVDRGHEVTYVAPFTAYRVAAPAGIRTVDVRRSRGLHRLRAVAHAHLVLRRLLAAPDPPDVVLAHDPELVPALLLIRLCHRDVTLVWDVHEDVPAQVDQISQIPRCLRRPLAAAIHAVELVAERFLHLLLAEHAYAERFARAHPVVPNSTRVPPERPAAAAAAADRLVYVGALTVPRGTAEMIAAARLLPDVGLDLLGAASPESARLLEAAPPNVRSHGFVPNAEALQQIHGALAGLVLLRPHENYLRSESTKIVEYMAHGVPVITTANPGARHLVESAGCGVVVAHGGPEAVGAAVAAAVRSLQQDAGAREEMARSGYEAARAGHDWGVDGERFVDQLEAWAAGAGRGPRRGTVRDSRCP